MMKFTAISAIVIGLGMVLQWTASYLSKNIPELKTEPIRIGFHIVAEQVTAICLIVSGVGILTMQNWSRSLYLISVGMLFYTSIVSPGYFAQQGKWMWLGMFAIVIAIGLLGTFTVF